LKTYYQKRFLKDLANIPSKPRKQIEKFVFEQVSGFEQNRKNDRISFILQNKIWSLPGGCKN